jgi:hypothetical protein
LIPSETLSRGLVFQRYRCHHQTHFWLVAVVAAIAIQRRNGVEVPPT